MSCADFSAASVLALRSMHPLGRSWCNNFDTDLAAGTRIGRKPEWQCPAARRKLPRAEHRHAVAVTPNRVIGPTAAPITDGFSGSLLSAGKELGSQGFDKCVLPIWRGSRREACRPPGRVPVVQAEGGDAHRRCGGGVQDAARNRRLLAPERLLSWRYVEQPFRGKRPANSRAASS